MNGNRMVLSKETSCQNEMHGMLIFKKKSFLGHSTNSPRVHCLLNYTVCSMDAYWDTCINLMIKSGCRQKLWKMDW